MKQCVQAMLQSVPATWNQIVSSASIGTCGISVMERLENRFDLRESRLQQERPAATVCAGADEEVVRFSRGKVFSRQFRDAQTVGDLRDRAVKPRSPLAYRRGLEGQLRRKVVRRAITGHGDDHVG